MLTDAEGEAAVRIARRVVEGVTSSGKVPKIEGYPGSFMQNAGAFTTLNTYPERELRGCIGIPLPVYPLLKAIMESALSATRDPRFPALRVDELDKVIVEVSVLTPPEVISVRHPKEYIEKIKIGHDGLILEYRGCSGLLLPQVPLEHGWDVEEYLAHLSMKAGVYADAWTRPGVRISRFSAEVFHETEPGGKVLREERLE